MVTPRATPTPRTSAAALPDEGKAKVTKTENTITEYVSDKPKNAETQTNSNANGDQSNNQIPQNRPAVFAPQRESFTQDRLSAMFEDVKASADFDGEQFVAIIVREPDHMTDRFAMPCSAQQYYPPFSFNPSDQMNFIPQIQRFNGNSGGRFSIRITDSQGEDLEIGLKGFVIANPIRDNENVSGAPSGNGEFAQLLQMMQEDRTRQDNRLEQLIAAMNQPRQDDDFTAMVKEKMRSDFLNPPEKKSGFDPQEFASKMMESQVMIQSFTSMFANVMQNASGGNSGREQDKGIIMSLLSNEKVMDIIGNTVDNVTNLVGDVVLAKAGSDSLGGSSTAPNPTQSQQQQPQPEQPTPEQIAAAQNSMKELSSKIVDELLSENPLDDDNETMNNLAAEYPQFLSLIRMSCKGNDFATVHKQLQDFLPDQFAAVPEDQHEHLETRLSEFYTYMRES